MPLHECFHVPVTSCQRAEVKRVLHCDATTRADMDALLSETLPAVAIFSLQQLQNFIFTSLSLIPCIKLSMMSDIFISRTDDLTGIEQFFQSVGTPTGNTGDRKERCEQFFRDSKHGLDKSTEKIKIGTDWLEHFAVSHDLLFGKTLYTVIQSKFIFQSFFFGKFFSETFQKLFSWIG